MYTSVYSDKRKQAAEESFSFVSELFYSVIIRYKDVFEHTFTNFFIISITCIEDNCIRNLHCIDPLGNCTPEFFILK